MTATFAPGRTGLLFLAGVAAAVCLCLMATTHAGAESIGANAEQIGVNVDQATIIKLPDRAATLVVGNPLIADVSVEPGNIAVITGKGYGATNIVVMDRSGAILMEKTVEVRFPSDSIVVVYRGINRDTFSCTPDCSRRITLGDFPEFFDKTLGETTSRNTQAAAAAASTSH